MALTTHLCDESKFEMDRGTTKLSVTHAGGSVAVRGFILVGGVRGLIDTGYGSVNVEKSKESDWKQLYFSV